SIIANNPASGTPRECYVSSAASFSGSRNLTNDTLCPGHIGAPTNVDPVLADNGGSTLTHALMADSNAIDAYDGDMCPVSDQRGQARPAVQSDCDLGALESEPLAGTVTSVSIN